MIFERGALASRRGDSEPQAARLLAVRAALRALPARGDLHPMNPGPDGVEEMDCLCLLALRGVLVAWTSALYPGVGPDALARAAAPLDALTASLDAGRERVQATFGYSSDYFIGSIEQHYDCARLAVRWVREALATRPRVPLAVSPGGVGYRHLRDAFDTLPFFGPEGWRNRDDWSRLQAEAFEADRAQLAPDQDGGRAGAAERVRALALAPLWHDPPSAAGAANLTFGTWLFLVWRPGGGPLRPLGGNALRWLEERRHGALVLGHAPEGEAERLVRIANLPDSFWDDGPAADVGYTLDDCLDRKLTDPLWATVRPFRSPPP